MAQINGISLKKVTHFKDHEGCPIAQGTVYYKGKALGEWSQDSWGGPDIYRFDERILNAEVEKYKESDLVEDKYRNFVSLNGLLNELLRLISDEKSYKQGVKKGYNALVLLDRGYRCEGYYTNGSKDQIEKSKDYLDLKSKGDPGSKMLVYTSLDDFKLTV